MIPPRYKEVQAFSEGLAAVQATSGLWGFVDKNGVETIKPQFSLAWSFSEHVAPVYRGKKCGFIDANGTTVVPFRFNQCAGMNDGIGVVRVNKLDGFINASGEFLITPRFEDAELFFDGLAVAKQNGKWGYIGKDGQFVIPPQFEYSRVEPTITRFSEGLAGVTKDGKFGYIDKTGTFVIAPQFRKGGPFKDGIAEVCNSRCGYIDMHGARIWPTDSSRHRCGPHYAGRADRRDAPGRQRWARGT